MAQQTAVEWFYQRILAEDIKVVFEQAKAMEKEQIKNAYWNGTTDMEKEDALLMGEDYFNEYYKK
jgi:NACalpha-BTF3-like transcription factor